MHHAEFALCEHKWNENIVLTCKKCWYR